MAAASAGVADTKKDVGLERRLDKMGTAPGSVMAMMIRLFFAAVMTQAQTLIILIPPPSDVVAAGVPSRPAAHSQNLHLLKKKSQSLESLGCCSSLTA